MIRLPQRAPFRTIALLFVLISLVPMIAVATFLVSRIVQGERASNERRLLQGARLEADAVDQEMLASIRSLSVLAEADALRAGDLADFYEDALRAQRTQRSWYAVVLIDLGGTALLNTRVPWGAPVPVPVDAPSVSEILRTRKPVIGMLKRGGNGNLAFPIRVPVQRDGRMQYVLTAVVSPAVLQDLLLHDFHPHEEWTRTLIDPAGTIVARTRNAEQFVGQKVSDLFYQYVTQQSDEGVFQVTSREGVPVYSAYSRAQGSGWVTTVVVPTHVLDAAVRQSRLWLAGLSALGIGIGFVLAWAFASRMSRGLRHATTAAGMLAKGESPEPVASRVSEILALDAAIQESARLLAERRRERDEHLARANESRAAAEHAARAKDEFLAMLGHELRNPLSPIVTALHLLRMKKADGEREYAVIDRQVRHLTRLVDDLLDVSRITRGKIELKRVPLELGAVVAQALEMASPLLEQRQQRLSVHVPDEGCSVVGDPARLAQVVSNLLVNASKYTAEGGSVWIDARVEGGDVVLRVRDNGRGLSPELLPRVFDLFVQGPRAVDRQEGGLGLGLTLVKQLVQLHGGTVSAESPGPGEGSTFSVRLPVAPASAPAVTVASPPVPRRPMRVLIVDDNVDALETLSTLVRAWGHEVLGVADTAAALQQAPSFAAQVALVDIGLPVMDGYELAAVLRQRQTPAPAFVAVTGYGQHQDRARSAAEGFVGHLVKPIDTDELQRLMALVADRHVASW